MHTTAHNAVAFMADADMVDRTDNIEDKREGSKTKSRNDRRRDTKNLKIAQSEGKLGGRASLSDFREWKKTGVIPPRALPSDGEAMEVLPTAELQSNDRHIFGTDDILAPSATLRQNNAPVDNGNGNANADMNDLQVAKKRLLTELEPKDRALSPTEVIARARAESPTNLPKISAAARMVLGSLGLRPPKTAEERQALQQKMSLREKTDWRDKTGSGQQAKAPAKAPAKTKSQPDPVDEAKKRLDISVVECVMPDITLPVPPFPFKKVWCPMQREYREEQHKTYRREKHEREYREKQEKKNKRKREFDPYYNEDEDEDEDEEIDGQDEDHEQSPIEDFPGIPNDITTLPVLTEPGAGDVIAYTALTCTKDTGFEPLMRTHAGTLIGPADNHEPELGEPEMRSPWRVATIVRQSRMSKKKQKRVHGLEAPEQEHEWETVVDLEREEGVRLVKRVGGEWPVGGGH